MTFDETKHCRGTLQYDGK